MKLMPTLAVPLVAALALLAALPARAEVKVALDSPPDMKQSGTYVWAHTFSDYLNSHGVKATEYPRNSLGEESERLDQVSTGVLEVSMSDAQSAGRLDGTIYGAMMPFFLKGPEQLDEALYKGGMLKRINAGTTPHGVRVLDLVHLGLASGIFTTKVPVRSFADFSKVRMRALDKVQLATFAAWGGTGTVVSWSEVPNALQTGVAGGYINPPFVPLLYGHTAFIKYFTDLKIAPSIRIAIASEDWYEGLSDDQRKIVDQATEAAHKANRDWLAGRAHVLKDLEAAGITVIEPSPEERQKFRDASEQIYEKVEMPKGALAAWKAAIAQ
ncbi:TRAP transporter substrate-binding protein [Acidimangrovimonas sediminis]|uniref:TRAP transporter substrate-binding protein n=1 Tax=Acidimangrovimonas sediminis TaxID=2056283 RepID=UPI0018EA4685|nr:TRAP transporter substrate-binding protein [Acidimangrovimonas sediminis]